jgi:hypothetical protein
VSVAIGRVSDVLLDRRPRDRRTVHALTVSAHFFCHLRARGHHLQELGPQSDDASARESTVVLLQARRYLATLAQIAAEAGFTADR